MELGHLLSTTNTKTSIFDHLTIPQLRKSHKKGANAELKKRLAHQEISFSTVERNTKLYNFLRNPMYFYILTFLKNKNIIWDNNNVMKININMIPMKLTLEEENYFSKSSLIFLFQNGIIQDNLSLPPL
jgi:hypothetical protein